MSALTEAERRRQRREQKILAGAGDRLSRITGTSRNGDTSLLNERQNQPAQVVMEAARSGSPTQVASPKPISPKSLILDQTTSFSPRKRNVSIDDDPDEALGAPPSLRLAQHFSSTESPFTPDQQRDAYEHVMRNFEALAGGQAPSGDMNANPLAAMLAQMTGAQEPGGGANAFQTPFTEEIMVQKDQTGKWWKLLHFVVMWALGLWVIFRYWSKVIPDYSAETALPFIASVPLFWYFITAELILQSSRLFWQKRSPPPPSIIGTIANALPQPIPDVYAVISRYSTLWNSFVQDCCILVFVIGLASMIWGSALERV